MTPPFSAAARRRLVRAALAARKKAYAPYSRFHVGAAVLAADGKVYTGANVENASYGLTICAERAAISTAVSAGARAIRAIAVVGAPAGKRPERGREAVGPCGACRQVIFEFGPDADVLMLSASGVEAVPIRSLLPKAFGPASL